MVGGKVGMTERGPGVEKIKKDMAALMGMDVLVGIPQEKISRRGKDRVNNAELLYIHTHGSPLRGISARPSIEPSIEAPDNKEKLGEQLGVAAKLVLSGRPEQARQQLKKVGALGRDIAKGWFTDPRNNWPPNSPATVARKTARLSPKQIQEAHEAGDPLSRVLIDSGQMRNALTYVVREDKNNA